MKRAGAEESAKAAAYATLPGYFSARLTRAYPPDQVARGMGMSKRSLLQIASCNIQHTPVHREHRRGEAPIGTLLSAHFSDEDEFLYVRGRIFVGDRGPGDAAAAERANGRLQYVSAGFTMPELEDPRAHDFDSELVELSLVDNPHDPYAQVLVSHGISEGESRIKMLMLCFPTNMSAPQQPETASAPASTSAITPDQIKVLIEENKRLAGEVKTLSQDAEWWRGQHAARVEPLLGDLKTHIESDESLQPEQRGVIHMCYEELAKDYKTTEVAAWAARQAKAAAEARAELQRLKESQSQSAASNAEMSDMLRRSFQTPAQGQQPPLIQSHHAGAAPARSSMAEHLARLIQQRQAEFQEDGPTPKRR